MPTLHNPSDVDLWFDPTQEFVPAGGSIDITDAQAEQVNTTSGIWEITSHKPQPARRSKATRGGAAVEVDEPPDMETR